MRKLFFNILMLLSLSIGCCAEDKTFHLDTLNDMLARLVITPKSVLFRAIGVEIEKCRPRISY